MLSESNKTKRFNEHYSLSNFLESEMMRCLWFFFESMQKWVTSKNESQVCSDLEDVIIVDRDNF